MTNPKIEEKGSPVESKKDAQRKAELRIASEIHTLAQLLSNELAMTTSWTAPFNPMTGMQPPLMWPPIPYEAAPQTWPSFVRGPW